MKKRLRIDKGTVQETLLLPLWGRAYETQKNKPRLVDNKAVEILNEIDYDFSTIAKTQSLSQHGWIARSLHTDKLVLEFIEKHPEATIVNIGCGMDTTFSRIDNGKIMFYELDLPDVIAVRKNFYKETNRHQTIASSFLNIEWFEKIQVKDGLLLLAGGVFMYFREEQIKMFFLQAANYFKNCEIFFDALSPLGLKIAKKQVLKKGGMGLSMDDGWGLKPIKGIENWNAHIKVINSIPMYKVVRKGLSFKERMILSIPDVLRAGSMIHLRIG